ncbi:MarR family winged helix-turn-helix transcriptional regulator [Mesorhizobium sp. BR1-1-16]|uniref:MarR family winged helix-turn-helix transcriptional regulator n=1 Tax=Mesorhizobium sp. BR1-1-16 TaxID=2876653 RepID=UPI001CCF56D1|nr:MarR family winged helix-turn-helix transcriptional regulator [Mesorhizobium sp. BR1-1-16]MBZ9935553.1 MarR family winged helix-turn-helix transcriptional regulator [Mesorhizobium sp. BR1-1-16]
MSTDAETLGLLIKAVQHRHHRALDTALSAIGITLVQWNALREIDRNPGASMHRLAELTFNSDQAFGTLVNRLLQAGLVERQQGRGRVLVHVLTPHGGAMVKKGASLHHEVLQHSFAAISEVERDILFEILSKLARNTASP